MDTECTQLINLPKSPYIPERYSIDICIVDTGQQAAINRGRQTKQSPLSIHAEQSEVQL